MKIRKEKDFISVFDECTGKYIRTGIIKNGKDTGEDPFMSSFPELLDVGIMGHCTHGRAGLCMKAGTECYQDGLHSKMADMPVNDFKEIARQCKGRVYQFALGGCGDPDQHGDFEEILQICCGCGIVPNFTTSGFGMTDSIAALCKKYCGAVAVSWYRSSYTANAIDMLTQAGVKTNVHYILNRDSVAEALDRLKNKGFPVGINAVVFLLHKPVGMGTKEKMVPLGDKLFGELIKYIGSGSLSYKVGFDSCTVPALVNQPGNINQDSLDTCEGARWSAYISPDMKMFPCSFDNQEQRWAVDLRTHTIKEAWESKQFESFRDCLRNACPGCEKRSACMGGCPIRPEIVMCDKRHSGGN